MPLEPLLLTAGVVVVALRAVQNERQPDSHALPRRHLG
jgi:hypothetical protein